MDKKIPLSFSVSIYGDLKPYEFNRTMSLARVRTFYKYLNRNGGFFTDETANTIIQTAAGTPVVGHYDHESQDFTSHMAAKYSKAYGFIPPDNPGFAWEFHADRDGVVREYACFNVVLWTERYEEAKKIPGKAQSMELDPTTIQGEWKFENNIEAFYYTHCDLLGLCVLGDEVEPCFEGAAFYSLEGHFGEYLNAMREEIVKNFTLQFTNKDKGGKKKMKFNVPEDSKFIQCFNAVNPKFNEENDFQVDNVVHSVTDNGCYMYNLSDSKTYTIQWPSDTITTTGNVTMDFSSIKIDEASVINILSLDDEQLAVYNELVKNKSLADVKKELEDYAAKVLELQGQVEEKEKAIQEFAAKDYEKVVEELNKANAQLKSELAAYAAEQAAALEAKKDELIDSYSNLLDAEEITQYKEEKSKYTLEELEGKLAVRFARKYQKQTDVRLPNGFRDNTSPIVQLLNAYKVKKGE